MSNTKTNKKPKPSLKKVELDTKPSFKIAVVLPDIRSSYNIGSIFRTSDAAGVSMVYLSGYSPRPLDKFNRPDSQIAKTALGAEKTIPWEYFKTHAALFKKIKKEGYKIVAVEQAPKSIDYKKIKNLRAERLAFVFGNEVDGLSKTLLKYADYIAEIPMAGEKESLNVSVTAGIILFSL